MPAPPSPFISDAKFLASKIVLVVVEIFFCFQ